MRIIGGQLKGRVLISPDSQAIRPTSDRLRETLFNILQHGDYPPLQQARVLDLFAGTGALGLEALSRGAYYAVFVDEGSQARGLIRDNIQTLGLTGVTRVFRRDATHLGMCAPQAPFNYIFLDPPYLKGLAEKAVISAVQGGWLAPDHLIVIEESREASLSLPEPLSMLDQRVCGESQFMIGRWNF